MFEGDDGNLVEVAEDHAAARGGAGEECVEAADGLADHVVEIGGSGLFVGLRPAICLEQQPAPPREALSAADMKSVSREAMLGLPTIHE